MALLTLISLAFFFLGLNAGVISVSVSLVILTYLIVRKNIVEVSCDPARKSLIVRYLPWFGKLKEAAYPINSLTEVNFVPADIRVPFLGTRPSGRFKLVIARPTWYELEFFTSDFNEKDLHDLHQSIHELKVGN